MRQSQRGQVDPFIVMDVMEAASRAEAQGRRIVHMEVGQPSTPAPRAALDALGQALSQPLGYTIPLGMPELRAAIAGLYRRWYGIDLDPARVVVTPGSSGAFVLAFSALFDAGDRVAVGEPGYPSYRQILRAMSVQPVGMQTRAENRYQPVPRDIPADVQGVMIASPGNPSGTMLDRDALAALVARTQEIGAALVSDEIYHGLDYGARPVSALELTDDVVVINSFSKYFSMTGWRVGWMVVPQDMVRTIGRLAANMFICAPHASQVAALAALSPEADAEAQENLAVYAHNRQLMLERLPAMGFDRIAPPDGAFYIYADVSALTDDSRALAAEILDRAGVAVTPGLDFDPIRGAGTLRLSYAQSTAEITEGLDRLAAFMAGR
ncbi:MAG TPA: aminotransferase class I/II-fold pyridoxal phosphate-dependent enzyme [Paracoccus solventivorans]|uniref:Aminotransferase n=1 Tax=Paracoccus solventivorans TaxID=53463 RepID=A0A832QXG4_9RHOB|nr:aminotransferase class I/II-fold pyridoxal phosphate-dependent enzyme [Paracoccus solventivorans]HHW35099.1 aminotransferase class I/II-fold pyridoxal phosphate-dependent enzyme [Paracoccus solventivorans]